MSEILEQVFNGVSLASILLLIALGLTFTFGQMGVINMAHGELIMAGAFTPYALQTGVGLFAGAAGAAFVVSLPVAFVVAGAMGLAMERLLIRRMYARPLAPLLVTFGMSLILQQAAKDLFGAPNVEVIAPSWLRGNWQAFGFTMPHSRIFMSRQPLRTEPSARAATLKTLLGCRSTQTCRIAATSHARTGKRCHGVCGRPSVGRWPARRSRHDGSGRL